MEDERKQREVLHTLLPLLYVRTAVGGLALMLFTSSPHHRHTYRHLYVYGPHGVLFPGPPLLVH